MTVLVIGGNRLVGPLVVERLVRRGCFVTVFNRGRRPAVYPAGVTHVTGDRRDLESLRRGSGRGRFDVVIDMVAYDAADVAGIDEVFRGRIGQYVFVSSSFVYAVAATTAAPLVEGDIARPAIEARQLPAHRERAHAYGVNKRSAENWLGRHVDGVFPVTVLRPPYIVGETDLALLPSYVSRLLDGDPLILPDGGSNVLNLAYAPDVAGAIDVCAGNPAVFGEVMNLGSRDVVTLRGLIAGIARRLGVEPRTVNIPSAVLTDQVDLTAFPCSYPFDLVLDSEKARRLIGYVPASIEDALHLSVPGVARAGGVPDEYHRNRPAEHHAIQRWAERAGVVRL